MKCLLCDVFSFQHICKECQEYFLMPSLHRRKVLDNIEVISFYKYDEIKNLIHTKHTDIGYYIYKILAQNSFKKFAREFHHEDNIVSIAIDDNPNGSYSHTALLNKELKNHSITPLYNKLRASSPVSYSGKSREFRLLNPRNFYINNFKEKNVILVDDIITTGSTLEQAIYTLNKNEKNVLFCLTLVDISK